MLCDYFDVQDFFLAGLGFDIAGAALLARGVISSPLDLTRISGSFWGSQPYVATAMARDRIDAITGLIALGLGFFLQAVGYTVYLAVEASNDPSPRKAIVGFGLLVLAGSLVVLTGWAHRRVRLTPTVVEMSHYTLDGKREAYPRAALLPRWVEALDYERHEGEDDLGFVRRTVGVEDLVVDVPGTTDIPAGRTRLASEPPLEGEPAT